MKIPTAQKGFTLIELLIVIVIIGVLAGIVIVILNPAVQRRRAQDAVITTTMDKMIAEVHAYANSDITGAGTFPNCLQLAGTLQNVNSNTCATTGFISFNAITTGPAASPDLTGDFRFTSSGSSTFCISAQALNPPSGITHIRYVYGTNTTPVYGAVCP